MPSSRLVLSAVLSAFAMLALMPAQAQSREAGASNPILLGEAKGWDVATKRQERNGNKLVYGAFRATSVLHVDLPDPKTGERIKDTYSGQRLLDYLETQLRINGVTHPTPRDTCYWQMLPNGDALSTCVEDVPRKVANFKASAATTRYVKSIVGKDTFGLFIRESWRSDTRMF
jgi:hypothetical protein